MATKSLQHAQEFKDKQAVSVEVLLVEDSPLDVDLIRQALSSSDTACEITVVDSEEHFRQALVELDIDIILCDYQLPTFDGTQALRWLGEMGLDIPLIIVSGVITDETAVGVMKLGASDYLLKDRLGRLGPAIERAILERRLRASKERADARLTRSEELKRTVLNSLSASIAVLDNSGKVVEVNGAWRRWAHSNARLAFGVTMTGENYVLLCEDAATAGDRIAMRALEGIQSILSGGQHAYSLEYYDDSGAEPRWQLLSLSRLDAPDGGVVMSHQDISLFKKAEDARRETEKRFKQLVEEARDIIYRTNTDGKLTYANPVALKHMGLDEDEVLGRDVLFYVHSDYRVAARRLYARQLQERIHNTYFEFPLRGPEPVRWLGQNVQLILQDGEPVGLQAVARDITDRKNSENDLVRAREDAEEVSRLKSYLLANISHEIRTPLSAIIGFASVLREEVDEVHKRFATYIEAGAQRLLGTLNSLLNLSALEAGSHELVLEPTVVGTEVEAVVRLLESLAREKGLALEIVNNSDEAAAMLDCASFDRIINNLVGNAIKFTDEGFVRVEVESAGDAVTVRVSDSGIGIATDFLPQIFDEFKQESEGDNRQAEGIGLGLAISRRLTEMMGGVISVSSNKGRGSTFEVRFPVVKSIAVASTETLSGSRDLPIQSGDGHSRDHTIVDRLDRSADSKRPTVLALDDNKEIRDVLEALIDKEFAIETVATEDQALLRATHQHFDAVLLDINLSSARSGVDTIAELRRCPGYDQIPVIAITGKTGPGIRRRLEQSGFDDYLSKPFRKRDLIDTLHRNMVKRKNSGPIGV